MFPFENIAGQIVIKGLGIPFDQSKVLAVVLGVTLGTGVVISLGQFVGGMEAPARAQAAGDFRMTAQTFERGRGTELVAVSAVQCPIQRFVRARKGARGNLCPRRSGQAQNSRKDHEKGEGTRRYQLTPWGMSVALMLECARHPLLEHAKTALLDRSLA
jgi:hypothetical protein